MSFRGLLDTLRQNAAYQGVLAALDDAPHLGLIRSARAFVAAGIATDSERPLIVITARGDAAYNTAEQLVAWNPDLQVLTFAEPAPLFYERATWGEDAIRQRVSALAQLSLTPSARTVIVTSARALLVRTLPPELFTAQATPLRLEHIVPGGSQKALMRAWLRMGYEPSTVVTEPGTYSQRGGIIDVFPVMSRYPVRIELWGDEVGSLRTFDPLNQRSIAQITEVTITPGREALPERGPLVAEQLAAWFDEDTPDEIRAEERQALMSGSSFRTMEFYLPWMVEQHASLLDYAPPEALVVVDDWEDLADTVADLEGQALEQRGNAQAAGDIPPEMPLPLVTWGQLQEDITRRSHLTLAGPPEGSHPLGDQFQPGPRFAGQLNMVLDDLIKRARGERDRVVVLSQQSPRLAELWYERGRDRVPVYDGLETPPQAGPPVFVHGSLTEGFVFEAAPDPLRLYTDAELFGWRRPEPRRRPQRRTVAPEQFYADLTPGDYVVHTEYGIGRFEGLDKRTLMGNEREYLIVSFFGGDSLYVPIHQADRLNHYVGPDDRPPTLSRLGTQDWAKVKARTREAVEEIAEDLLELYARRETVPGHAFSPDGAWQLELEASFPYVETNDQLRTIGEVKADMERQQPMDRLICGDVGYGKTEVALRAAFKAVMDGKQVAMLVPTTVLAQQHYETFIQRMEAFPIEVGLLSRFRTRSQQEETIEGLHSGTVDVVIGTHRLLGDDVAFHDLGLLIIDEEQRFGVTHKEKLKQMRTEVDVLTMTATPIPRTLYMSLTGVRDISMITTAPDERLPVVTHVGRRDNDLIRQAILREVERGGQVFYVHNRVRTIEAETYKLQALVPEVAFGIGHGQMNEHELEEIMGAFAQGEIDVLVTTSIIEAGLDIPNANTLIVDRADRFGLSQLYQLRGRVGRSAVRAYSYFFHPSTNTLTPEARARLDTIAEHSGLSVGMNIAMRDLEIRGAGDILGARQSGHIGAVGFNLYTQMLADAVRRMRAEREKAGEAVPDEADLDEAPREVVTIELPIPTFIPGDYIADMGLRVQLYRRMANLRTDEAIAELYQEIEDRFGDVPRPVENLLYQLRVKHRALAANVEGVLNEGTQVSIRLSGLAFVDRPALQRRIGRDVRVSRTAIFVPRDEEGAWRNNLLAILEQLEEEDIRLPKEEENPT